MKKNLWACALYALSCYVVLMERDFLGFFHFLFDGSWAGIWCPGWTCDFEVCYGAKVFVFYSLRLQKRCIRKCSLSIVTCSSVNINTTSRITLVCVKISYCSTEETIWRPLFKPDYIHLGIRKISPFGPGSCFHALSPCHLYPLTYPGRGVHFPQVAGILYHQSG